ncbi:MAG: DNA cytosine methyltransferase [Paracoccaceae bacterium]|nr:DNA cytosine methyltransferase [Paracoccaceae bacterium]MDE2916075.1 DNA cytosine methyltransferase [Paracoccaceae bacterium]
MKTEISEISWIDQLQHILQPNPEPTHSVIDLFCGAGGFSLGFAAQGFRAYGIDRNADAVSTFNANVGDAKCMDLSCDVLLPMADVLIAGPPCQPWSRAGKKKGALDVRDGFPSISYAIRVVKPTVFVVENVPDIALDHQRKHLDNFISQVGKGTYKINEIVMNASNYGVPQNRRRIFIFGVRDAKQVQISIPCSHHISVRDAIADTCYDAPENARFLTKKMDQYIARYEKASGCRLPRDLHLDRPARTLTVRNLAGATGDMMRLSLPCGRRRMLTVQEAARLQSFPDWFHFTGSHQSQLTQIGNAVPPLLSLAIARQVRQILMSTTDTSKCI